MIINNNSKNILVKYISILINQTHNNSCNVTSLYKNNIYNDFDKDDECVCSNLIGYNFQPIASTDRLNYCKIDYAGGQITNIVIDESEVDEKNTLSDIISTKDFGTNSLLRKKRLMYQITLSNTCYGRKLKQKYVDFLAGTGILDEEDRIDFTTNFIYGEVYNKDTNLQYNTGKFLIREINDNDRFFEDTYSVVLNAGDTIYCRKSTMKRIDSLCANIAMYLNSRFPILISYPMNITDNIVDEQYRIKLTESLKTDICRYFTSTDSSFNSSKGDFDLDSFICSFLLGRTITPNSSMEDIKYVQKLLEDNFYTSYYANVYGEWDDSLTRTLYEYQLKINERYKRYEKSADSDDTEDNDDVDYKAVLPTGYFDIITEKYLLQDKSLTQGDFNNAYSSI